MSEAAFDPSLLARASRRQILVRMLLNLKKLYVKMHSFPQARATTDALLALQPSSLADLRDRGLARVSHERFLPRAYATSRSTLKVARLSDRTRIRRKKPSRSGNTSRRCAGASRN